MVKLTRLNRMETVINSDLIQSIDTTPDTVITLINGEKLVVMESADTVIERVLAFRRNIIGGPTLEDQASRQ